MSTSVAAERTPLISGDYFVYTSREDVLRERPEFHPKRRRSVD